MQQARQNAEPAPWAAVALAAILCAAAPACSSLNLRGQQSRDDAAEWMGNFRSKDPPGQRFGWSAQAQEIESHLGK